MNREHEKVLIAAQFVGMIRGTKRGMALRKDCGMRNQHKKTLDYILAEGERLAKEFDTLSEEKK